MNLKVVLGRQLPASSRFLLHLCGGGGGFKGPHHGVNEIPAGKWLFANSDSPRWSPSSTSWRSPVCRLWGSDQVSQCSLCSVREWKWAVAYGLHVTSRSPESHRMTQGHPEATIHTTQPRLKTDVSAVTGWPGLFASTGAVKMQWYVWKCSYHSG